MRLRYQLILILVSHIVYTGSVIGAPNQPINLPAQLDLNQPPAAKPNSWTDQSDSFVDLKTTPLSYNKNLRRAGKSRGNLGLKINTSGIGFRAHFSQFIHEYVDITEQLSYERFRTETSDRRMQDRMMLTVGPSIRMLRAELFAPYMSIQAGYERERGESKQMDAAIAVIQLGMHIKMTKNFWLSLTRNDTYYSSLLTRLRSQSENQNTAYKSNVDAHFTLAF